MNKKMASSLLAAALVFGLAGPGRSTASQNAPQPTPQASPAKPARAGSTPDAKSPDRDRIVAHLKEDIRVLSLEPRFSEEQYGRAVTYVTDQAKTVGLTATPEDVEDVLPWAIVNAQCELTLPAEAAKPLDIVALSNSAPGEVLGKDGKGVEIIRVEDFHKKDDAARSPCFDAGREKPIVYFSRRLTKDKTLARYLETVPQRNVGASWAAKNGAAAVLVRSVQTGDGPTHGGAVKYEEGWEIPAAALNVKDADLLETLLAKDRVFAKLKIETDTTTTQSRRGHQNVVVRLQGTRQPEEIILLSAHLDSHYTTWGAADDAAGVAAVLAVMRHFVQNPPKRTILFVFYADEEVTYLGGEAFPKAKKHKEDLKKIKAVIEMDDGDGAPRGLQITSLPPNTAGALRFLEDFKKAVGSEADGLGTSTDVEAYGSDVGPLWNAPHRIPEIAILQDLSNYFDKHHAKNDTPENIDFDGLWQTTSLLLRVMDVLASGEKTPPHGPSASKQ